MMNTQAFDEQLLFKIFKDEKKCTVSKIQDTHFHDTLNIFIIKHRFTNTQTKIQNLNVIYKENK